MRKFILVVFALIAGAIAGYAATMALFVAYIEFTSASDNDGGGSMVFGLFVGPVVALVTGLVAATVAAVRIK